MQDCCPNCGNKDIEKLTADGKEIYCPPCDKTFKEVEGKRIKAQPANRITQIEDDVKTIKEGLGKVFETLKTKPKADNVAFNWGQKE